MMTLLSFKKSRCWLAFIGVALGIGRKGIVFTLLEAAADIGALEPRGLVGTIKQGRGLVKVSLGGLAGVCPREGPEEVVNLNSSIKTIVFQHYIAMFIITTKSNNRLPLPNLLSTPYNYELNRFFSQYFLTTVLKEDVRINNQYTISFICIFHESKARIQGGQSHNWPQRS